MEYLVVLEDGSAIGPFDLPSLLAYKNEGKIQMGTHLRDFMTGREFEARYLPELFPMAVPPMIKPEHGSQSASPYPRKDDTEKPMIPPPSYEEVLRSSVMRSTLVVIAGLMVFPVGAILAVYNVYVAFQLRKKKSEHAELSMKIALGAFAILAIVWSLRQNGLFG